MKSSEEVGREAEGKKQALIRKLKNKALFQLVEEKAKMVQEERWRVGE